MERGRKFEIQGQTRNRHFWRIRRRRRQFQRRRRRRVQWRRWRRDLSRRGGGNASTGLHGSGGDRYGREFGGGAEALLGASLWRPVWTQEILRTLLGVWRRALRGGRDGGAEAPSAAEGAGFGGCGGLGGRHRAGGDACATGCGGSRAASRGEPCAAPPSSRSNHDGCLERGRRRDGGKRGRRRDGGKRGRRRDGGKRGGRRDGVKQGRRRDGG